MAVLGTALGPLIAGCGGATPPPASVGPASPSVPSIAAAALEPATAGAMAVGADHTTHAIARSSIRAVVAQGLGAFLRRVDLDDHPVLVAGRFHGFRIAALRDAALWRHVDLRPGDVVTSVNGLPIERPDQAQTAFESLGVASELRVAFDRDGQPDELVYPIVDGR